MGTAVGFKRAAVDLADNAIAHCRAAHGRVGLKFMTGDAEHLSFADASFDVVRNVESSHCYPDMPRFLEAVYRVLRPGGVLVFADLRPTGHGLREQIAATGCGMVEEEDITADVNRALLPDTPRRRALVERSAPTAAHPQLLDVAGVEGSGLQRALAGGQITYLRLVVQRPLTGG